MQILNQGQNKTCATFAVMGILLNKGIVFDLERLSKVKVPYYPQVEKLFKDEGLIKQFVKIPTTRLVDLWLSRGEWLITSTSRGNFNNPPNVTFDGKSQHFFIIKERVGDKYKCINSWGNEWGEEGCFYINISDFKYLFTPRRVITK